MVRRSSLARVLLCCALIVVLLVSALPTPPVRAAASLELYGTFHAMGVIVTIGSGEAQSTFTTNETPWFGSKGGP